MLRETAFRDGAARLLVFGLGVERFAISLAAVDEVIDAPETLPLPDAPARVAGIATVRGELVTMYDPRALLRVGAAAAHARQEAALLFARDARRVGVLVDDVYDAMTIHAGELRPVPGADASDRLMVGLVRRGSDLVAVLDVDALLASVGAAALQEERSA
jgi:purine-binding chemotaxis protein CheW